MNEIENPFLVYGYKGPEYFCDRESETIDWLGCKYAPELFPLKRAQRFVAEFNR